MSVMLMFRIFFGDHQGAHRSSINLPLTSENEDRLPDRPSVFEGTP